MKMRTTILLLAVVLSACHGTQGTNSTTSSPSSSDSTVYSVQYYMDHQAERRARVAFCTKYRNDRILFDKNCQNARDASLGVGDY